MTGTITCTHERLDILRHIWPEDQLLHPAKHRISAPMTTMTGYMKPIHVLGTQWRRDEQLIVLQVIAQTILARIRDLQVRGAQVL